MSVAKCINMKSHLTILFINIQSLNSKYQDLKDVIFVLTSHNSAPDLNLLQETWLIPQDAHFKQDVYNDPIFKVRSGGVQGGGVRIYSKIGIKSIILQNVSIFHNRILETLIVDVTTSNNTKFIVASEYRPNTHPTLTNNQ